MKASKIILPHFVFISQAINYYTYIYFKKGLCDEKNCICRGKRYEIDKSVDVKNNNL